MTESKNIAHDTKGKIIINDLGFFEGFNFRSQRKMDRLLTATEVVNWDHPNDGDTHFWPSGDHEGVLEVFRRKDWYYEPDLQKDYFEDWEIQHLDDLISCLGDEPESFAKIIWHLEEGCRFFDITAHEIKEGNLYVFRGKNFYALKKKAAYKLFKEIYPEDYKLSLKNCCRWLTFDPVRFLRDPRFSTMEITIGNEELLIVDLQN